MVDDLDRMLAQYADEPEFVEGFERGHQAFKLGVMLLSAREQAGLTQAEVARKAYDILASLSDLSHQTAEPPMREFVERSGLSANQVFGILRVAVTGQKVSPPLFESMEIIGKETVLERLQKAIDILQNAVS